MPTTAGAAAADAAEIYGLTHAGRRARCVCCRGFGHGPLCPPVGRRQPSTGLAHKGVLSSVACGSAAAGCIGGQLYGHTVAPTDPGAPPLPPQVLHGKVEELELPEQVGRWRLCAAGC